MECNTEVLASKQKLAQHSMLYINSIISGLKKKLYISYTINLSSLFSYLGESNPFQKRQSEKVARYFLKS